MPIGFHVSRRGGSVQISVAIAAAFEMLRGYGFGRPCAQIFVTGPQNYKMLLGSDDGPAIRSALRCGGDLVIHGAYIDHPWNRTRGSIHNIKAEMRAAAEIGAEGVIVHLGAGAADDANFDYVMSKVAELAEEVKASVTLWLEIHTAKPSAYTYETPEKLAQLFERMARASTRSLRLGLCIDTAHLYSCGTALDTREKAEEWLDEVDRLSPGVPKMLHLNDSAAVLGGGRDVHECLTRGNLWGRYNPETGDLPLEDSGLVAVLEWADRNGIMTILERGEDGILHDLNLIQGLGFFQ